MRLTEGTIQRAVIHTELQNIPKFRQEPQKWRGTKKQRRNMWFKRKIKKNDKFVSHQKPEDESVFRKLVQDK